MSNIAFSNLRAEMSRDKITVQDIAGTLNINRDTASRKLAQRSPLMLDEAMTIRNAYFPKLEIDYLFAELASLDTGQARSHC